MFAQPFSKLLFAMHCGRMQFLAIKGEKVRVTGFTKLHRLAEDRVKHRREIAG